MEADWEVELGPGAAIIDVSWSGFVDLEREPERIGEIAEASHFQPLAEALLVINGRGADSTQQLLRTIKCDLWPVANLDPDEMDAFDGTSGRACYIDLIPRGDHLFATLAVAEQWARRATSLLTRAACPSSRVDLVIRQAVTHDAEGMGISAYVSGCGPTFDHASLALANALRTFTTTLAVL